MNDDFDTFFDPSRREQRRERKIASRVDRSKYKHSDLRRREERDRPVDDTLIEGRIVLIRSQDIEVATHSGTYVCTLRGTLKQERHQHKNLIIVGDLVLIEILGNNGGLIHHVLPRKSILSRQDHLHHIKNQLVAANVDQVLITMSIGEPSLRTSIIDRYLVAAAKGNLHPTIIINKIDLKDTYPDEKDLIDKVVTLYTSLSIPIITLSARTGEGMEELKTLLKDKISVFSGQSGTGKTMLVNALTGLSLQTQQVRSGGKGAHTTTSARLLPLPCGGWCIDTPGIRSFGIWDFKREDLLTTFSEIAQAGFNCLFKDCSHRGESGCCIEKAMKDGVISPLRYSSYLSLLSSLEEGKKW